MTVINPTFMLVPYFKKIEHDAYNCLLNKDSLHCSQIEKEFSTLEKSLKTHPTLIRLRQQYEKHVNNYDHYQLLSTRIDAIRSPNSIDIQYNSSNDLLRAIRDIINLKDDILRINAYKQRLWQLNYLIVAKKLKESITEAKWNEIMIGMKDLNPSFDLLEADEALISHDEHPHEKKNLEKVAAILNKLEQSCLTIEKECSNDAYFAIQQRYMLAQKNIESRDVITTNKKNQTDTPSKSTNNNSNLTANNRASWFNRLFIYITTKVSFLWVGSLNWIGQK